MSGSRRRVGRTVVTLSVAAIGLVCIVLALVGTRLLGRAYNDMVLDNRDHGLSCDELPMPSHVYQVMQEHQDAIEQIKQVHPGFVYVEVDTSTCPGKADILISFGTHSDRKMIEAIVGGTTFFGIPYRLRNI